MIKNAIIAAISAFCLFFVIHSIGAFDYGSVFDRNERVLFETQRAEAVGKSSTYKLALLYSKEVGEGELSDGVEAAVAMFENEKVNGKGIELVTNPHVASLDEYARASQGVAEDKSIVALIGPHSSGYIPTIRALTQLRGLPLVSPCTLRSEQLPPLEPDNYVTFFAPLQEWNNAMLDHMEKKGLKNLMIVSPQKGTYGDIFATSLERLVGSRNSFEHVFRLNYEAPLKVADLQRMIKNFVGDRYDGAIFFGGYSDELAEFLPLASRIAPSAPIYGTDLVYEEANKALKHTAPFYFPRMVLDFDNPRFISVFRSRYGIEPSFIAMLGGLCVINMVQALKEIETYTPQEFLNVLHKQELVNSSRVVIDDFYMPENK